MTDGLGLQLVMVEQAWWQELLTAVVERMQDYLLTSQETEGDECWSLADFIIHIVVHSSWWNCPHSQKTFPHQYVFSEKNLS